jgi:small subunit ribosomal protein S1
MVEQKKNVNKVDHAEFAEDEKEFGDVEQSFEALFEKSLQELNTGDVVKGTIVQVNPDSVIVDVGYKSEGVIPLAEFTDEKGEVHVKVGDE